ncbi:TPA: hypothetical protein DCX15_06115 [bacterium]|nr:hypothetical protein [bacterium]
MSIHKGILKGRYFELVFLCLLVATSTLSWADSNWKAKKSKNFTIFYREPHHRDAEELLSILEHYREEVMRLTGNEEGSHTCVTIFDWGIAPGGRYNYFDNIEVP